MHIGQILDSIAQAPVGPGTLAQWEFVLRLFVAAILGSLIGIERERLAWRRACAPICWSPSGPAW